jgi:hypothetical protein
MYKRALLYVFFIVCSLIVCLPGEAQRRRKANLNDDVPLPIDFTIDYQLGLTERGTIRSASPLLENTPYNEVGTEEPEGTDGTFSEPEGTTRGDGRDVFLLAAHPQKPFNGPNSRSTLIFDLSL